jgi:hypothetical protein
MNWTALVFFGPLLLSLIWYLVDAHKWYKGPKSNLDPETITYGGYEVPLGQASSDEKVESKFNVKPRRDSDN